ncbi:hypothetical protein BDR06DRAFT_978148, partial [Suillus hirtellus]
KNGVTAQHCFFKGGMSTLHTHVARNPDHFAVYQAHCKNLQIPMNARVCPKSDGTLQQCMEHTINLTAGHFLMAVSPTSSQKLLKKIKVALRKSELDGSVIDFDVLDASLEGVEECEDDDDDDVEFGVGDLIGKALVLIRASSQARAFFAQSCKQADVPTLELMQLVQTRWASMHSFITQMLLLQKGVNIFVKLADDSDEVPNIKGKYYADFWLDKKDWEKMKLAHEEPASATQTFSSSQDPSVWRTLLVLEFLQQSWENMAAHARFFPVHDALQNGLKNIVKWYDKTKDTSAYSICLALNLNVKLAYAEHQWEKESFDVGLKIFERVFDAYYVPSAPQHLQVKTPSRNLLDMANMAVHGSLWLCKPIKCLI